MRRFAGAAALGQVAFQVLRNNFLTLYASRLGFSTGLIGILVSTGYMATVVRIWGARRADRLGCKKQMIPLVMWGPLTLLPLILAPQIGRWFGREVMILSLFVSVMSHAAIASFALVGWRPLLRRNLPSGKAIELLGVIYRAARICSVVVLVALSLLLGRDAALRQFQVVFFLAALAASLRAFFLRDLKDVEVRAHDLPLSLRKDIVAILANPYFRRLLTITAAWYFAAGLMATYRPLYLKELGFSDTFTVLVTSGLLVATVGVTMPFWGRLSDKYGSRGVYTLAAVGAAVGNIILAQPRADRFIDGVPVVLGIGLIAVAGGAFLAADTRRVFTITPRRNQSLYMMVHLVTMTSSFAAAVFLGGQLLGGLAAWIPTDVIPCHFAEAPHYRCGFLISAAVFAAVAVLTQTLRDLKEVSAARLLFYMRLRAQRRLMSLWPGSLLGPYSERDDTE